ncbi:MAG: Gfo/Idh/MocA family oxidoreductase [Acidobacteria bacterium]|nr:Gfo/Idh/MocA family oxidoreductase [Acidobacteriota bacterium]
MVNWVVVGVGDIATKRVIPAIQAEARSRLAGVVTRDPAKAAVYGVPGWATLEQGLAEADAVYVATPVALHAPQTMDALRAGRHVLCEKPMALTCAQALEMQRTAEENGRTLGIAYYRRCYPKVQRALELIRQGAIGRPVFAELTCHDWFNDEDGRRGWLLDPRMAGGGPLLDIASHRIDLLNFWFGAPGRVHAQRSNLVHHTAVEDNATVMVEYDSGVRGIVDVRWHSRVARDECRIRGAEGEIDMSPLNGPRLVWPGGEEYLPPHANLHYPCIQNFVSALLEGAPLLATGASSLLTDWVTEQALRSDTKARDLPAHAGLS